MKKYRIFTGIVLATLMASSHASINVDMSHRYTLIKQYGNEETALADLDFSRTRGNHPTRVIRVEGKITQQGIYCEEVQKTINESFFKKLTSSHFMYNTLIACNYDPDTQFASRIVIDSYIDPLTNEDETVLEQIEQDYEGYDFYGVPLHIEKAKGVAVSLEMNAAREDGRGDFRVLLFRRDHKSLYFDSNYELNKQLITDIRQRFYSQDKNKILPFIQQWFYNGLEHSYEPLLHQVNLMELMPERIFLMQAGKPIFTSHLHMYYTHHCQQYDSRVCLS